MHKQREVIEWHHWFHQNAELSNREFKTAERIASILKEIGYKPQTGVAKTGVVAVLKGGRPGPVVGLRVEIDIQIDEGYPVTYNEPNLYKQMSPTLERIAGKENVEIIKPITGAEDFSFYQKEMPGLFSSSLADVPKAPTLPPLPDTIHPIFMQKMQVWHLE